MGNNSAFYRLPSKDGQRGNTCLKWYQKLSARVEHVFSPWSYGNKYKTYIWGCWWKDWGKRRWERGATSLQSESQDAASVFHVNPNCGKWGIYNQNQCESCLENVKDIQNIRCRKIQKLMQANANNDYWRIIATGDRKNEQKKWVKLAAGLLGKIEVVAGSSVQIIQISELRFMGLSPDMSRFLHLKCLTTCLLQFIKCSGARGGLILVGRACCKMVNGTGKGGKTIDEGEEAWFSLMYQLAFGSWIGCRIFGLRDDIFRKYI